MQGLKSPHRTKMAAQFIINFKCLQIPTPEVAEQFLVTMKWLSRSSKKKWLKS